MPVIRNDETGDIQTGSPRPGYTTVPEGTQGVYSPEYYSSRGGSSGGGASHNKNKRNWSQNPPQNKAEWAKYMAEAARTTGARANVAIVTESGIYMTTGTGAYREGIQKAVVYEGGRVYDLSPDEARVYSEMSKRGNVSVQQARAELERRRKLEELKRQRAREAAARRERMRETQVSTALKEREQAEKDKDESPGLWRAQQPTKEERIREELEAKGIPIMPDEKIDVEEEALLKWLEASEKIEGGSGFVYGARKAGAEMFAGLGVTFYAAEQLVKRPGTTAEVITQEHEEIYDTTKESFKQWGAEFSGLKPSEKLGYVAGFLGTGALFGRAAGRVGRGTKPKKGALKTPKANKPKVPDTKAKGKTSPLKTKHGKQAPPEPKRPYAIEKAKAKEAKELFKEMPQGKLDTQTPRIKEPSAMITSKRTGKKIFQERPGGDVEILYETIPKKKPKRITPTEFRKTPKHVEDMMTRKEQTMGVVEARGKVIEYTIRPGELGKLTRLKQKKIIRLLQQKPRSEAELAKLRMQLKDEGITVSPIKRVQESYREGFMFEEKGSFPGRQRLRHERKPGYAFPGEFQIVSKHPEKRFYRPGFRKNVMKYNQDVHSKKPDIMTRKEALRMLQQDKPVTKPQFSRPQFKPKVNSKPLLGVAPLTSSEVKEDTTDSTVNMPVQKQEEVIRVPLLNIATETPTKPGRPPTRSVIPRFNNLYPRPIKKDLGIPNRTITDPHIRGSQKVPPPPKKRIVPDFDTPPKKKKQKRKPKRGKGYKIKDTWRIGVKGKKLKKILFGK